MKIFKELNKLGYKHYTENTVEELDDLPLDSEERIMEQALVLRWFREKHVFYVNMVEPDLFYFVAHLVNPIKEPTDLFISEHCKTHEKAELACLKKLIELSTKTA
jgi:hypothetical protein